MKYNAHPAKRRSSSESLPSATSDWCGVSNRVYRQGAAAAAAIRDRNEKPPPARPTPYTRACAGAKRQPPLSLAGSFFYSRERTHHVNASLRQRQRQRQQAPRLNLINSPGLSHLFFCAKSTHSLVIDRSYMPFWDGHGRDLHNGDELEGMGWRGGEGNVILAVDSSFFRLIDGIMRWFTLPEIG